LSPSDRERLRQKLLDGSTSTITLQTGYGSFEQLVIPVSSYATNTTNTVSISSPTGTFQAAVSYAAKNSQDFQVVDLNGDGKLDFLTADASTRGVVVNLANGDGTFSAPITYNTTGNATSIAAGDVFD
jgi:hypothetical protein